MNNYSVDQLDQYLVELTNLIEPMLPSNVKLADFLDSSKVYGFYGIITSSDLFTIDLIMPSRSDKEGNIPNILIKYVLSKYAQTDILSNQKKRNLFIKYIYDNHKKAFINDGNWTCPEHVQGDIYILKRLYVKNDITLPPVYSVAKSYSLLASIDPQTELNNAIKAGLFN